MPEAENSNLALLAITVHPRSRRQGIGTEMLPALEPELRARGRHVMESWDVTENGPGELWAHATGFRTVHSAIMQLLLIAETDPALWNVGASAGYRIEQWAGTAPENLVASYARARGAIHDAPVGDLGFESPQWTADRVREAEADLRERGVEQRVVVAVHEATGEVAGLTELELRPHRPTWASQRDTAVLAAHRGHGLGRWIKAHMVRWLLVDRPGLERIYTGTGADNVHMARVNHELGFTTVRRMVTVNKDVSTASSAGSPA